MTKKCEGCGSVIQWFLRDRYHPEVIYNVCSNCLLDLVMNSLSKKQFSNLLKSDHKTSEFLLHGDFYSEEGEALQPVRGKI